jgi:quercetin dioxygenase-like cupin family protein
MGYRYASLEDLGSGPGFRKVRRALDVTEFGVNAVVLPPGYTSRRHYHDRQQELYLVLRGKIEFDLDGAKQTLGPGGLARVDAPTVRSLRNASDGEDAVYLCVGAEGGYVGRDGQVP